MDKFDIEVRHPDYEAFAPRWKQMRDAFEGEDAIKRAGETYLPMKSGVKALTDKIEQKKLYDSYKARAEFPDLVAPTVRGCVGMIHSKDSVIELPKSMEYLRTKATADGMSLSGLHLQITRELLKCGRYGLMPGISGTRFHLAGYEALSPINWDEDHENEEQPLSYLVLNESGFVRDPITNKWESLTKYRECLMEEGAFVSRLHTKTNDAKDEWVIEDDAPAFKAGNDGPLNYIPFVFINTSDLTATPDDVPLYGLAKKALRIYRLDADYSTALHMTSEPTPWVAGVTEDAPKSIGAASLWVFSSPEAKCGYLEFSGPGIASQEKAISNAFEQAVTHGAQVLANGGGANESGEARSLRLNHQGATLTEIAKAAASGLERALKMIAEWSGANADEVAVKPNMDFVDTRLSPQDTDVIVRGWLSGAYSRATMFENLQKGEIIRNDLTLEDELERMADDAPLAGLGAEE